MSKVFVLNTDARPLDPVHPLRLKIDPGSQTSGLALVNVANVLTWTKRLLRLCPSSAISLELVKFDLQQIANPEISGMEYQQGTIFGYELRQYLLEKWSWACSYCGAQHIPLQVEHIQATANGGTDRVSNLCLACDPCNKAKGTKDIRVFLAEKPDLLARILAQAKSLDHLIVDDGRNSPLPR